MSRSYSHEALLSAYACHGSSLRASHLPVTILAERYHTRYAKSLVGGQKNGEHNVVDFDQYKSRRREESTPTPVRLFLSITNPLAVSLPSWQRIRLSRFYCPAPIADCYPKSPVAKTVKWHFSHAQSSPVREPVPLPIATAPCLHHIPDRRGSMSWESAGWA